MASDGICKGSCNHSYRKARAIYDQALTRYTAAMEARATDPELPEPRRPEPPDIKPWYGEPNFCGRCASIIHTELAELDDLAALRSSQSPGERGTGDQAGRVSGTTAVPSPSPRADDIDELAGHLREWEATVRGADTRPRRGYLASEITTVVAWLSAHFAQIIAHPGYGEDFGTEVRRWHRELTAKCKAGTGMRHQKKPCPRCRLYTLWLTDGEDYIRCVNDDCQRRLTREDYANLDTAASWRDLRVS